MKFSDLPVGQSNSRRLPKLLQRLNDLGVIYEQDFRESVVLPRAGRIANMSLTYISD